MRRNAATIALTVTLSALLCAAPLLARPTRTLSRPAARRTVLAQPMHRVSRERPSQQAGKAHRPSYQSATKILSHAAPTRHAASFATNPASRYPRIARSSASFRLHAPPRTLAAERNVAAHAAIAAADRNARFALTTQSGSLRTRSHGQPAERSADVDPATPSADSSGESEAIDSSAGSGQPPSNPETALTNVGGELRPAAGSLPHPSIEHPVAPLLLPAPLRLSSLYDSEGRLIMPRPLFGSRDILLHQNEMADRDGLNRIQDDADLLDLRRQKKLVALPESEALHADFRLPEDRRYARPWTAAFLSVIAADFYATFHIPLQVDSAVRTIAVQQRLLRTNGNAAPTSGDTASPHLTGQAVDIAKGSLTRTQIAWMRLYLQPLIELGKIDVEEEFHQSCFHISVYRNFLPGAPARVSIAATRQPAAGALAERPSY